MAEKAMDKLKRIFGFADEEEYVDYDYDYPVEEMASQPSPAPLTNAPTTGHISSNTKKKSNSAESLVITVHEPLSYDESPLIVDDLREHKAVVLNFEQLDIDVKREIFDFVSGALYALDGKIQKVNKDIFILAPYNIAIDGLKEELKNNGMFPW